MSPLFFCSLQLLHAPLRVGSAVPQGAVSQASQCPAAVCLCGYHRAGFGRVTSLRNRGDGVPSIFLFSAATACSAACGQRCSARSGQPSASMPRCCSRRFKRPFLHCSSDTPSPCRSQQKPSRICSAWLFSFILFGSTPVYFALQWLTMG